MHHYVYKKTNPLTQTRGGNATTLKKTPPPCKTRGGGSSIVWVRRRRCLLVVAVVAVSSCPLPLPLPVVPGLTAPHFHTANSCSRRRFGVLWWWWWPSSSSSSPRRRSRTVGFGPSFCCHPPPRCCCCCWCARFIPWPRCSPSPPRKQLLGAAVGHGCHVLPPAIHPANSGIGVIVFPPRSCCAPHSHPVSSCSRQQLGVPSWYQCIPAIRRPVVHPASRGLQQ